MKCGFRRKHFSMDHGPNLCSPNEDFGRPNKHFRTRFRRIFKGVSTRFGLQNVKNCFETSF
jgi:hypothetical protein